MKLTVQELNVIIDTLLGSTRIIDSALGIFKYTTEAREQLANELISRGDMIEIGIDTNES